MKHSSVKQSIGFMLTSTDRVKNYLRWANWLVYASVVLGILLISQLYALSVPLALLVPIFVGWIFYLIVAFAVWKGYNRAYLAALILAVVTLAVSLPQPEHVSLAEAGLTLASLTFFLGSILQVGVILLIGYSMVANSRQSRTPK